MSDGITDAEREGTLRIENWKRDQITAYLSTVSTAELVDALCKREDVTNYHENFTSFKHHIIVVKE